MLVAPHRCRRLSKHAALRNDVESALAALAQLRMTVEHTAGENAAATRTLAAQRCVKRVQRLCERLVRHLGDEEDLVVPLLLEHGDA